MIQKELNNIPNEKVRRKVEEYLKEIKDGKRDFWF